MKLEYKYPAEIEKRSMDIIEQELGEVDMGYTEKEILKRVIHTTADFDYRENLYFSPGAVRTALSALEGGADVVTDTNMALAGINKGVLKTLGAGAHCFMADRSVMEDARAKGITRAAAAVERLEGWEKPFIYACGNAPTALIRLRELIDEGKVRPALVIATPVGFVNVVTAKELIIESGIPNITARGRKGGSTVAAAIVNALLYKIRDDRE